MTEPGVSTPGPKGLSPFVAGECDVGSRFDALTLAHGWPAQAELRPTCAPLVSNGSGSRLGIDECFGFAMNDDVSQLANSPSWK
jgi:hypothetical protein